MNAARLHSSELVEKVVVVVMVTVMPQQHVVMVVHLPPVMAHHAMVPAMLVPMMRAVLVPFRRGRGAALVGRRGSAGRRGRCRCRGRRRS